MSQKQVIEELLGQGWIEDGHTRSDSLRMPTTRSPIFSNGKSGGKLTSFGGRPRFHLPGTNRYVTVGPRTTCFYVRLDGNTTESEIVVTKSAIAHLNNQSPNPKGQTHHA